MKKNEFKDWDYYLFLGCDSQVLGEYERSDSIIVLSINRKLRKIILTSILRDTWVELPGYGMGKINAAVWYGGPKMAMEVISGFLGIKIKKYAIVNMEGMVNIIDLFGGVDIDIDDSERRFINHFAVDTALILNRDFNIPSIRCPGISHLNGVQTVAYMRNRKSGGIYERSNRQRKVLKVLAKKALKDKSPLKIIELLRGVKKNLLTNISLMEVLGIAPLFLRIKSESIISFKIPAEDTYEVVHDGIWRMEPDYEENRRIFKRLLLGTDSDIQDRNQEAPRESRTR